MQDPYSLRCVPQVHGAVRDALDHLRRVLDVELNSATDNPLVFPEGGSVPTDALATGGGLVISGGNFHGEPIALALDFAKLALSELGAISERRIALMVDPRLNGGLPAFLTPDPGRNSGLMITQYTAAALASENKVFAHPASADSIPTSANQEDHVSMGASSARHARTVLGHVEQIIAIELLAGAQALDLRLAKMAHDADAGAGPAGEAAPAGAADGHDAATGEPAPAGAADGHDAATGEPAPAGAADGHDAATGEPAPAGAADGHDAATGHERAAPVPGLGVAEAHERIRARVSFLAGDREPGPDMAALLAMVHEGALADLAGPG